jgi:hypothetical protein
VTVHKRARGEACASHRTQKTGWALRSPMPRLGWLNHSDDRRDGSATHDLSLSYVLSHF